MVCMWLDARWDLDAGLRHDQSRSLEACGTQHVETKARPPRLSACGQPCCEKVHPPSVLARDVKEDCGTALSPQLCAGIDVVHLDGSHTPRSCPIERHSCVLTT